MTFKIAYLVFCMFLLSGVQCDELHKIEDNILDDIKVPELNILGLEKLEEMFLGEDIDDENQFMRKEMISAFLTSFKVCQHGVNEASEKMNVLLDYYDPNDVPGAEGQLEEDEEVEENELEIMESDMFDSIGNVPNRPTYIRDLERLLQTFNHACSSLPSTLPNVHQSRKPRSPQKLMKRLVHSLSKWSERWMNTIENKFAVFMTDCLNSMDCKANLEKLIQNLIQVSKQNEKTLGKEPSGILQELLQDLSHKNTPSMESLSYLQRAVLEMGNSFDDFGKEEEESFQMAEGISSMAGVGEQHVKGEALSEHLGLLTGFLRLHSQERDLKKGAEVEIEMDTLAGKIPSTFLSVAFGSSLIQENWGQIRERLPRFKNIASSLSPSMLRVGGSASNFMSFDPVESHHTHSKKNIHPKLQKNDLKKRKNDYVIRNLVETSDSHPKWKGKMQYSIDTKQIRDASQSDHKSINHHRCDPQFDLKKDYRNFTMTGDDWKFLVNLVHDLNWTLVFDLNQFWRDPQGNWDPTNSNLLLDSSETSKIPIVWQLGNEPNAYQHKFGWSVSPEQAVKDYESLRHELQKRPNLKNGQVVVGPDVTRPKHVQEEDAQLEEDSMEFLERFLEAGNDDIDAVTWHQYYIDGHTATLDEFLSLDTFNMFPKQLAKIVSIRDTLAPGKSIWLTETASAWGGGAPGLSNRFVAGLPWLDKLGAAALGGASLVFRQTMYGGCYGLLDSHLQPYPDFWVSVVHKHTVGEGVLLPRTRLVPDQVRIYAHCLNQKHPMYKKGAIVIVGINLSENGHQLALAGNKLKESPKFLYQLSPPQGHLQSEHIWLNGRTPKLESDGSLPPLIPFQDPSEGLDFVPWSMHFWVLPEAGAGVC